VSFLFLFLLGFDPRKIDYLLNLVYGFLASLGPRNVYKDMLNKMVSLNDHVVMNHQNQTPNKWHMRSYSLQTQAPTCVNHQHPTVAFRLNKISDQNVVLEDLQGHNRASKNLALSVDPEDGMQDTELTADDELGIGVTKLCCGKWRGSHHAYMLTCLRPAARSLSQEEEKISPSRGIKILKQK
jgi:hypothetical protein